MSEYTPIVTDDMVAEALDAKATMSQLHCFLYATEKCRCGEDWTDAHWMRFILERALSRASVVAEEPEWEWIVLTEIEGSPAFASAPTDHETAKAMLRWSNDDGLERSLHRRRKAGPWLPVKQKGADSDA